MNKRILAVLSFSIFLIVIAPQVHAQNVAFLQQRINQLNDRISNDENELHAQRDEILAINQQWHQVFMARHDELLSMWHDYKVAVAGGNLSTVQVQQLYQEDKAKEAVIKSVSDQKIAVFKTQEQQIRNKMNILYMNVSQMMMQRSNDERLLWAQEHHKAVVTTTKIRRAEKNWNPAHNVYSTHRIIPLKHVNIRQPNINNRLLQPEL